MFCTPDSFFNNVYAEYAITRYYSDKLKQCITDYNISIFKTILADVEKKSNTGNVLATFIISKSLYDMYNRDKRNTTMAGDAAKTILALADKKNISAIAQKGFWGCNGYNHATQTKAEGILFLRQAADKYHPMAMAWLGSYYRSGECGLNKDPNKAQYYLSIAADFGHPYAQKELKKLESGDTSSNGCYITTIVCQSYGKADDCYELTMFRTFRDNWLMQQDDGKNLIDEYYKTAPTIVEKINALDNKAEIYTSVWKNYLSTCLDYLENKKYDECKELYCRMVND